MSRLRRFVALTLALLLGSCAALRTTAPPESDAEFRLTQGLLALRAGQHAEAFDQFVWVQAHCPGREAGARAQAVLAAMELDPNHAGGRPAVGMELLEGLIMGADTPDWMRPMARTTYLLALGLGARGPASPETAAEPPAGEPEASPEPDPAEPLPDEPAAPAEERPGLELEPVTPAEPDTAAELEAPPAPAPDEPGEDTVAAPGGVTERRQIQADPGPIHGCGRPVESALPADARLPTLPGPSLAAMLGAVEADLEAEAERTAALEAELATARRELAETRAELERIRRTLRP